MKEKEEEEEEEEQEEEEERSKPSVAPKNASNLCPSFSLLNCFKLSKYNRLISENR